MKRVVIILLLVGTTVASGISYGQTSYTGLFSAPDSQGMHTDSWMNLWPNSATTSSNNWNVYHKDGSPIFTVWFANTLPYVHIGAYKTTNLYINGSTGIGTTTPSEKLEIVGSGLNGGVMIRNANEVSGWGLAIRQYDDLHSSINASGRDLQIEPGWTNALILGSVQMGQNGGKVLFPGGNVGIGTDSPDSKLSVNGAIHSKEVKVDTNNWPDYVFETDYNLTSLNSIKSFIDENKHLPEVPSAKEMDANGVNLGEMNMLLLKKVEELTLYVIDQKNELRNQRIESKKQLQRIISLEDQLNIK